MIVKYKDYQSFTIADIPGIIEGAHEGKGLGIKFLRHIERTKILLFMIDITSEDYKKEFEVLFNELKTYSPKLAAKQKLIALTKSDLVEDSELKKISKKKIKLTGVPVQIISSAANFGIEELLDLLWKTLQES